MIINPPPRWGLRGEDVRWSVQAARRLSASIASRWWRESKCVIDERQKGSRRGSTSGVNALITSVAKRIRESSRTEGHEDFPEGGAHVERNGRQLWAECRQTFGQAGAETITRGVQRLHVDEGDDAAVEEPLDCDNVKGDEDCNSDDLPEIRPLGRKVRNGGASAKNGPAPRNRWDKKMDDDTGGSDGKFRPHEKQGMEVGGRAGEVSDDKRHEEGHRLRKKWDNLMEQFKKVHKFQNLSGGKNYFELASSAERSECFNFVMDWSVYDEMEAMTKGDHTIHPKNLADMEAAGFVVARLDNGLLTAFPFVAHMYNMSLLRVDARRFWSSTLAGVICDFARHRLWMWLVCRCCK
ncbi:hypothetical protein CBR_g39128 [Chara braunii]|uniref:Uncharacterized protein n=1 Tax=Chara braunii TaxID=69332 RepID=A0A388LQZ3_CHABU|nr:hypothetical protein CBR_g39128 [Chara braunii]|eukprot:GBG84750.1 hypothetical protein CBR_g39128 [Chara braunii]